MAEYADREHFLPIRKSDLVDLLCKSRPLGDAGLLTAEQQDKFRRFCAIVGASIHHQFHARLDALKDAYAPFDPDRDTKVLRPLDDDERARRLEALFAEFDGLLQRANFKKLSHDQIEEASKAVSAWGINLDVDFSCFDRLEVYIRGEVNGTRPLRVWYKPWITEERSVRIYTRLVIILKQRPHRRLGKNADVKNVLLRLFKDIPTVDIEMLLPGGRMKMPALDRGKLGASLASAIGFAGWKVFNDLSQLTMSFVQKNPLALYGPLSLLLGYGYKQYASYSYTKQQYASRLTESLYYQSLDGNAGVLNRLLDEAEEQECREVFLGYFHLWRHASADGWTEEQLDDYIEIDLERVAGIKVDFEVDDALEKLERMKLVERSGERYRAVPIDEALRRIDEAWDNIFEYNVR